MNTPKTRTRPVTDEDLSKNEREILQHNEREMYLRLITKVYPKGIVSIVSDTWDYWKILRETLPSIKDVIMSRDGKVVIRPDSGDPVKMITGYMVAGTMHDSARVRTNMVRLGKRDYYFSSGIDCVLTSDGKYITEDGEEITKEEAKGSIEILAEIFGYTINSKGYKDLDPHIGLIYGDSITLDRCRQICERLKKKGFSSTNVVFGIGSFTYQFNTRDTFSIACKATHVVINGVGMPIFKDPATGRSKKSAKGLLKVERVNNKLVLHDDVTLEEEKTGELITIFKNGVEHNFQTWSQIKEELCLNHSLSN